MLCTSSGSSGFALTTFSIYNPATRSPKILKNISKFNLIILNFEKNNYFIFNLKQLVSEFLKICCVFWDIRYIFIQVVQMTVYILSIKCLSYFQLHKFPDSWLKIKNLSSRIYFRLSRLEFLHPVSGKRFICSPLSNANIVIYGGYFDPGGHYKSQFISQMQFC